MTRLFKTAVEFERKEITRIILTNYIISALDAASFFFPAYLICSDLLQDSDVAPHNLVATALSVGMRYILYSDGENYVCVRYLRQFVRKQT